MAKRILVPLGRREQGEVAALVADIARSSAGTIRLLRVSPIPERKLDASDRVVVYADQEMARVEAEELRRLRIVATRLWGIPVESVVRFGHPVQEILHEAESFGADLIAMTTGKRSWLRRVLFRGVAEQVLSQARTTVMLLREASGMHGIQRHA